MADDKRDLVRPVPPGRNGPHRVLPAIHRWLPERILARVANLTPLFAKCEASAARGRRPEGVRRFVTSLGLGLAVILLGTNISAGGVLSESDFKKVENLKPLFQNLMGDLVQTSKRQDISSGDADCVKLTVRELLEISQELSSYEYLITIEKEMTDFNSDSIRDVVKFAIDKSNTILTEERKRLVQLSDQCTRFPLSFGKMQQALQFIDTTNGILKSIQPRL